MAGRGASASRPIWAKQAEEAKLKEEEQKAAAARAAFDATFKDVKEPPAIEARNVGPSTGREDTDSGSDTDEAERLANKPIGPVDPSKCTAAGSGVAGGSAGMAASFVIVAKDSDGRRVPHGGAHIKVKVKPGAGVSGGGMEQEAVVKDQGDGTYTVTYAVSKRGDYTVNVECNGLPILNSPFPVFFSGGTGIPLATNSLLGSAPFINGAAVQTPFTGLLPNMFPSTVPGLMQASNMPGLSQMPLPPAAAAMAAAQTIMVAKAYEAAQAAAAQDSASKENEEISEEKQREMLSRTVQVSNLSPLLTVDQLKTLFGYFGIVSDCKVSDSKQFAHIEFGKPEQAEAALKLNNMEVGGRPINVEMAKSLPRKGQSKPLSTGLPVAIQHAVAMQQLQFQQALLMQQAVTSQQAAQQAATVKSASEMAAARAAEISKMLKASGNNQEEKETLEKKSPSRQHKSRSRSRSPVRHRHRHRSRSISRSPIRYRHGRRSRSRSRDRHHHRSDSRGRAWFYRSGDDYYQSQSRHHKERDQARDHDSRSSRRSKSPRKSKMSRSQSPKDRDQGKEQQSRSSRRSKSPRNKRPRSRSPRNKRDHSHSPRGRREKHKSRSPENRRDHRHSPQRKESLSHSKSHVKEGQPSRDEHNQKSGSRREAKSPRKTETSKRDETTFHKEKDLARKERDETSSRKEKELPKKEDMRSRKEETRSRREETHSKRVEIVLSEKDRNANYQDIGISRSPMKESSSKLESDVVNEPLGQAVEFKKLARNNDVEESLNVDFDGHDKSEEDSKERRHSRKKHRKSEDNEKHDKRKRRQRQKHCKSPSGSTDAVVSEDGPKCKDIGIIKGHAEKTTVSLSNSESH